MKLPWPDHGQLEALWGQPLQSAQFIIRNDTAPELFLRFPRGGLIATVSSEYDELSLQWHSQPLPSSVPVQNCRELRAVLGEPLGWVWQAHSGKSSSFRDVVLLAFGEWVIPRVALTGMPEAIDVRLLEEPKEHTNLSGLSST